MTRIATLALAAASLFAIAGAATAAPVEQYAVKQVFSADQYLQVRKTAVSYADVDLSTQSGARVALGRIEQAATIVCGGEPDETYSDDEKQEFAGCRSKAIHTAVKDVKAPILTALLTVGPAATMAKN